MPSSDRLMSPDELLELARELVDQGSEQGVTLRLFGSLAIRHHIRNSGALLDLLERVPTRDIDFMGYSGEQAQADRMFKALGYKSDPSVSYSLEYGIQRLIYHELDQQIMVEVFMDVLRMAHMLDFRRRLELDHPTISLVDLLLSKLQIHQITEKDIKDIVALLADHALGSDGPETVDVHHLLRLTRTNWGFYHTVVNNLRTVIDWVDRLEALEPHTRDEVASTADELIRRMEAEAKSLRWQLRSLIGTRVRWYEQVREVHRSYDEARVA